MTITRVRAVDVNNDWQFGKGRNDYKYDLNAVSQNIKTRLQEFLGDCFFNQNAGVDWFNLMGSKRKLELNLSLSSIILNTQYVTAIVSFNFSVDQSRNAILNYEILTIFGSSANSFQIDLGVI